MYSLYVLFSKKLSIYYVGCCKDLGYRYELHLSKIFKGSFTTRSDDWEIFYHVDGLMYKQARKIERHIKRMKSRVYLQNLKNHPEIMNRLIVKYK